MKKFKKIMAAAIAMMTFSTAAAVTGTVAWFTANNIVSISGMNINAEVEEGIVISNESKATWKNSAEASHTGLVGDPAAAVKLIPTSTADGATWYHAYSNDANNAIDYTTAGHTTVTASVSEGIGSLTAPTTLSGKNIYLLNKFYIQGSSGALDDQDIFVREFSTSSSAELNKSLRVLVKYTTTSNGTNVTRIFEPNGASATYKVNNVDVSNDTIVTYAEHSVTDSKFKVADNVDIPAYTVGGTSALEFEVYAYFEGEDASCKSANASTLEALSISLKFENANHQA